MIRKELDFDGGKWVAGPMKGAVALQFSSMMMLIGFALMADPVVTARVVFGWDDPQLRPWWLRDLSSLQRWYNLWVMRYVGMFMVIICSVFVIALAGHTATGMLAWGSSMVCLVVGLRPFIIDRVLTRVLEGVGKPSKVRAGIEWVLSFPIFRTTAATLLFASASLNVYSGWSG